MLIIVEGSDKTGKSTLIEYLLKNLDNTYMMKTGNRPKDDSYEEREKIVDTFYNILGTYNLRFKNSYLILDRFFLSEVVYAFKRKYKALDNSNNGKELKIIKGEIETLKEDVLIIYCETDKEEIAKKFIEDKEDYVEVEDIKEILTRYREILEDMRCNKITYDYRNTTLKQVKNKILEIRGE